VKLARVEALSAWLNLERTAVKSPVSGRVARRSVQLGGQVGPSTALMTVVDEGRVWVDANFKESQLQRITAGNRAQVTVDMLGGGKVFKGVVAGLSPGTGSAFSLLPAENATGNWIKIVQRVPVRVLLLEDKDGGDVPPLIIGLSCRVKVFPGEQAEIPDWAGQLLSTDAQGVDLEPFRQELDRVVAENLKGPGDGKGSEDKPEAAPADKAPGQGTGMAGHGDPDGQAGGGPAGSQGSSGSTGSQGSPGGGSR
jgi:membrane fusion protein (multidrug efflux system)